MEKAKIHLSGNELKMIRETEWIFVKKQINLKVYELFGDLSKELRSRIPQKMYYSEEIRNSEPKISRGEQYKDLPYIILDYPRIFNKEGVFAFRTLFLWGKFVSVTLHVSGKYKQQYESAFIKNYKPKQNHYCCFESFCTSEWEHDIIEPHYLSVDQLPKANIEPMVMNSKFLKVAIPFSFNEWSDLPEKLLEAHLSLHEWLY